MYRYIIRLIEILRQISIWQRAKGKRSGNKNIKIKKSGSRVKRHKHWFLMLNPVFTNNAMVFTTILYVHCPLRALDSGDWVQQVKSGPLWPSPGPASRVLGPNTIHRPGLRTREDRKLDIRPAPSSSVLLASVSGAKKEEIYTFIVDFEAFTFCSAYIWYLSISPFQLTWKEENLGKL